MHCLASEIHHHSSQPTKMPAAISFLPSVLFWGLGHLYCPIISPVCVVQYTEDRPVILWETPKRKGQMFYPTHAAMQWQASLIDTYMSPSATCSFADRSTASLPELMRQGLDGWQARPREEISRQNCLPWRSILYNTGIPWVGGHYGLFHGVLEAEYMPLNFSEISRADVKR